MHYQYITTDSAADALAQKLCALNPADIIAIDTEFIREKEYYPKLALLQISIEGDDIYLVDPLCVSLKNLLPTLLQCPAKILIFSGEEDMLILYQYADALGVKDKFPRALYDVQLMSAFAGHSYGRGLFFMVNAFCSIELNKEQTRSDWLQRPLSEEQLSYAALDVAYLPEVYRALDAIISAKQREFFVAQMQELTHEWAHEDEPETCYRHVSGAGLLSALELTRLQHICAQRLRFAREQDEALNRVITNKALTDIARTLPATDKELARCGVKWGAIHDYGEAIFTWIKEAGALEARYDLPLTDDYFAHFRDLQEPNRKLRGFAEYKCRQMGMMAQLMGGKKALYELYLARFEGRSGWLETSWRRELLGPLDEHMDLHLIHAVRSLRQSRSAFAPLEVVRALAQLDHAAEAADQASSQ